MEVYTFPQQPYSDAYTIPSIHSHSSFTTQGGLQCEAMYSEGAPEYFVDQGLYYPTPTSYGYFYTDKRLESPGKWDDQQSGFGLDGQDVQYAGAQAENIPFLYYTPSLGYGQSPYNPYNPYIPGAVVGVDGPFLGTPHYYTIPSYDNSSSSPAYFPIPAYSRSYLTESSNETDTSVDANPSTANRVNTPILKHNLSSASSAFTPAHLGPPTSNKTKSFTRVSDGTEKSPVTSKRPTAPASVTSSTLSHPTPKKILQGGVSQTLDYMPRGKPFPSHSQLKVALQQSNGLSTFGSLMHGQHTANKLRSKFLYGRIPNNTKVCTDASMEQSLGPRVDKPKNKLTLRAYTRTAGDADRQGNIIIYTDQYNKDDFQVDYTSAKFFVIKSYSEDDVHKSIKYGVWSSTPNGNEKLNSAYEDAQRIANKDSGGSPIFLFFSVNASGQFCGVAEMTGPVDFHKDMDFWQQDKWSGSFPVKWHIIKDVPNPSFRHIILENNENKPVTNSRDTQEVHYWKGVEMLKVFKKYVSKTSLLDDFMYYENREKILLEEKARLLIRGYEYPFLVPVLEHPRMTSIINLPSKRDGESKKKNSTDSDKDVAAFGEMVCIAGNTKSSSSTAANESTKVGSDGEASSDDVLNTGTLTISSKQSEPEVVPAIVADSASADVMRIGSMPVKVNGHADSSGHLTFGTIDAGAFQQEQLGYVGKVGK